MRYEPYVELTSLTNQRVASREIPPTESVRGQHRLAVLHQLRIQTACRRDDVVEFVLRVSVDGDE